METLMKAGRELDALIAEKVMGWKYSRDSMVWYPPNLNPQQNVLGHEIPRYSIDFDAACEAHDRIKKLGYPALPFSGIFHDLADLRQIPRLVCLAALKSIEMAGSPGIEPGTDRLTADCSTAELGAK